MPISSLFSSFSSIKRLVAMFQLTFVQRRQAYNSGTETLLQSLLRKYKINAV